MHGLLVDHTVGHLLNHLLGNLLCVLDSFEDLRLFFVLLFVAYDPSLVEAGKKFGVTSIDILKQILA